MLSAENFKISVTRLPRIFSFLLADSVNVDTITSGSSGKFCMYGYEDVLSIVL